MPKIPKDATPDVQRSMRELWQEIDTLKRANITDLHGRRISNTGRPKQRRDYANKAYVDDLIQQFRSDVQKDIKKLARLKATGGGGTTPPPGNASISFGYWYVDTIHAIGGGQFENEVKGYTNAAVVFDRDGGDTDVPPGDRVANLTAIIGRLAAAGFGIWLDVGPNAFLQPVDMIQAGNANWDKVKYVLCGDEPDLTKETANQLITQVKNLIADAGLAAKPLGVTFNYEQVVNGDAVDANWDFVNIEAYATADCPSGFCPDDESIAIVKQRVVQMKSRINASKDIHLVMQGYDLSGALENIPKLAELNADTYFDMAKGDSRVKGINIFAYSRVGGSRDHPELKVEHQKIWADLTGGTTGAGAKKCAGDPRPCEGVPVCCDGGTQNPCCCPRLCELGQYMGPMGASTQQMIQAHPELFVPGTQKFLGVPEAILFRGYITVDVNTDNPSLEAVDDPGDGKQVLVRLRVDPQFREDYAVWATDLTPRLPPGAYRATCYPGVFDPVDC